MSAPPFGLPVSGTAPNKYTTREALEAALNLSLEGKLDTVAGIRLDHPEGAIVLENTEDMRAFLLDYLGNLRAASLRSALLRIDGSVEGAGCTVSTSVPGWALCIMDSEGNIAGGWDDAGQLKAVGFDTGGGGTSSTVYFAFIEPGEDACTGAMVSWVSDNPSASAVDYSTDGSSVWNAAFSHRSRPFPLVADRWIHTARIENLGANTRYNLRWNGALYTDQFKTPRKSNVKACIASDYQRTTYGAGSHLDLFGQQCAAQDCDVLLLNGDYVNDDGLWNATMGQRWYDFMTRLSSSWRRDGCLIPVAAVMGNHEARNIADTSNAESGGDGLPGPMIEIFSLGYDPDAAAYQNRSMWAFRVAREVAFIAYETSHTVMIADQVAWISNTCDRLAPLVRHMNMLGHAGAFYARNPFGWERARPLQAALIKRLVWPILSSHANKMRAMWVGHEHGVSATARLRMDWNAALTDEVNADRWITDPIAGVRQLGSGMIGGNTAALVSGEYNRPSSLDASPKMIAALGHDGTDYSVYGDIVTAGAAGPHNMWIATYSPSAFSAKAIDYAGHQFMTISETL